MAKKEQTKKKPTERKPGLLKRWWSGTEGPWRRAICMGLLKLVLLGAFVGGAVWGLGRLRGFVFAQKKFAQSAARVQLADRPEWMNDWLAEQLTNEFLLAHSQSDWTFDPRLAEWVHQAAAECPWVKALHEVRVERARASGGDREWRAGRVVVKAEWRRPVAIGVWRDRRDRQEYVADDGVVLPAEQAGQIVAQLPGLPRIVEVAAKPPAPGQRWGGADLEAALKLVGLLREKPYYAQIAAIDVSNFSRRDLNEPAINLIAATDQVTTTIRFGKLPTDGLPSVDEPSVDRKLGYLDGWYRKNQGRLTGPRSLDLRFQELRYSDEYIPTF